MALATLVALGLVATHGLLAQDTSREALLLLPSEIQAGGRSAATVTVLDDQGTPAAGVGVTLHLIEANSSPRLLAEGTTDSDGHGHLTFNVPEISSGIYSLRATVDGIGEALGGSTTVSSAPAILIETDKPIYKPSQTIQGRILLLDNALRPRPGEVEVTFLDGKGIRIDRQALRANEYGVAPFSLRLAREANFGVWKIKATSDGVESSRDVRVENYVLPRYDLLVQTPRTWVLVSEEITGSIEARYFFGKPVAGTVEVVAKRYVADWEEFARVDGTFTDGAFEFSLPAVGFVSGTPGNSGLGTVTLEVTATDSTGHSQTTTEILSVSPAEAIVQLISLQRNLKPGLEASFLVLTETPDGLPRSETVDLSVTYNGLWGDRLGEEQLSIETVDGRGTLRLQPPEGTASVDLFATLHTDGGTSTARLNVAAQYSPSSSFLSVYRPDGNGELEVGEEVVLQAVSTHPGTIFYDVFAGGRTVFSGASRSREIRFTTTTDMAPLARVVAYIINPDNEIAADTVQLDVAIPTAVELETTLDREEVQPGDPLTLTIQAGEQSMLGLSIVDCSVLALGRSRLHLGEVFDELERRFMEPRIEVHEGGGAEPGPVGGPGIGAPMPGDVWGPRRSPGALEIFREAGLEVVTTEGLRVPEGMDVFRDVALEDVDGPPVAAPGEGAEETASGEPPVRVRQFFPETWVWNPTLLTDESGLATLELTAPDSITCWEIQVVGSSPGGIGFGGKRSTVFQEFFVEPSLPAAVTRGEEFPIAVQIFNYLDEPQSVALEFGDGDWYELLGESSLTVDVPPNSAIAAHFPIRPLTVGEHDVFIRAIGSRLSDAVLRQLRVEPEGYPVEDVDNSVIEAGSTVGLDTTIPVLAIPDSGKAFLNVTPSPIAQTLQGLSDLLSMPFGCGEQNMIFLAPDVEVLRYLQATGEVMPEIQAEAEHFINVGYQRELTFQTDDGGFAAFGGEEGSLWLTAFVLSTFSIARDVRDIDETVLAEAAGMLVSRQNDDGSFRTDDFLIHKEMDGGLSNLYAMTAYVANALADFKASDTGSVGTALGKAAAYLADQRSSVADEADEAYSLSIAAVALGKVAGSESVARAIVDRLLELAITEGIGMHWEPYPVETTGYVALALLDQNRPQAAAAVDWLSSQRNALGGYGQSTQDTVVSIRALTEAALKIRGDLDVTLTVHHGDSTLATLQVDASNYDLLQTVELPVDVAEGLGLQSAGEGNVGYQVVRRYHLPGDFLPPPRDMTLQVDYDATGIEVDDLVDVRVTVRYTGLKERTGMAIVDVGVPTGFQPVRSTLDDLVEEEIASRVEIAGRKVIVYIDELVRGTAIVFSFQVRALYPVRAETPVSRAYEYYDPDIQASTRGPILIVEPPTSEPEIFIRGDSNEDNVVDLSDAVHSLEYQFLGRPAPDCLDRADATDDGIIDISDPIRILRHSFLGEAPPEPPYPDAGVDPTPDELDC